MILDAIRQGWRLWKEWRDRRALVGSELVVEIQQAWERE